MISPPSDFGAYMNWRRTTPQGRRWWRQRAQEHHVEYVCDHKACGHRTWLPKGESLPKTLQCPSPCFGMLVKQAEQQFTLDEEDYRE